MHLPHFLFASYSLSIHEFDPAKTSYYLQEVFMKNSYILGKTVFMKFNKINS